MDDFGVKYVGTEHINHLLGALRKWYQVTHDAEGATFCGISLTWDYTKGQVDLSMPGYIQKTLHKFNHPTPTKPHHAPHKHVPIAYGQRVQVPIVNEGTPLDEKGVKRVQNIVGTLLYYSRAVDPTLAPALSAIAAKQATATTTTMDACRQLLDYCATHPAAVLRYKASDMQLAIHADASYLSEHKARSRAAGHFYMANENDAAFNNGPVLTISTIIRHVMASAAEAELAAIFYSAQEAIPIRHMLKELGHEQKRTPITTDNVTAQGLIKGAMVPRKSKAMDMRFHWLRCRNAQDQFEFRWEKGDQNRADYFSKHHPPIVHTQKRLQYLVNQCVKKNYENYKKKGNNYQAITGAHNGTAQAARVCWKIPAGERQTRSVWPSHAKTSAYDVQTGAQIRGQERINLVKY